MRNILSREPVLLTGLIEAIIALLVAFGLDLSPEQVGAILGVVAVVTAFVARMFVSPVATEGEAAE